MAGWLELTVAEELQWPVDVLEDHVLVSDVTHSPRRVGPALHAAPTPRLLTLRAARLPTRRCNVAESDVSNRPMPNPSDREPVPAVAGQVPHDRVAAAAQDVPRILVTEVSSHIVLARKKLTGGHKGHAVIAIVDDRVLQERVVSPVDVDAVGISSAVWVGDGETADADPDIARHPQRARRRVPEGQRATDGKAFDVFELGHLRSPA